MHLRHGAPVELWQALVSEAAERAGCAHDESRESYLVFMLLRHQKDGQLLTRAQALDWLRAHAQAGRLRDESLREVGDRCLLIAGLYPALAERRRVDVGYFMDLGRSAYLGIADAGRSAYAALFRQLAAGFEDLVCTLRAVRPDMVGMRIDFERLALMSTPGRR